MKYYKIILAGKGAELYPFELNTKQYETFRDNGVEQDEMECDDICLNYLTLVEYMKIVINILLKS